MLITWGGVAFNPQPNHYRVESEVIGSSARMADGTLRADVVAEKARIVMEWQGLTFAQLQALRSLYESKAFSEQTLVLFDGRSYTVMALDGWHEANTIVASATALWYGVEITFSEV